MSWAARAGAGLLAVLAVTGTILWAHVTDRYIAASDIQIRIWENVGYLDVRLPTITSPDQRVSVGVLFYIGNPSGIAIEITQITYRFYMDNLSDTRPFAAKAESIFVAVGGFFAYTDPAIVGPRSAAGIWANLTVWGDLQPTALARLNVTFNERYYPIINADLVYRVHGTSIVDRVLGIVFATESGVAPVDA